MHIIPFTPAGRSAITEFFRACGRGTAERLLEDQGHSASLPFADKPRDHPRWFCDGAHRAAGAPWLEWRVRAVLLSLSLTLTAACGEAGDGAAQASEPGVLIGRFRAASETARLATGDVSIERGGLIFDRGVTLYTRLLDPRSAHERIARDGDSYAAAAIGSSDLIIELRRVTDQALSGDTQSLCGADRPGYVALAYEERAANVTLLVFAGDEPPGPRATQSRLCATFAYAAHDGARTRQGVVLQ